jgi:REP-associated tyrosine transposase
MPLRRPLIIAHHLIWVLYGHWLPNDPRGSGSAIVYAPELQKLGEAYFGRRPEDEQPTRDELRAFFEEATQRLKYPVFWLDGVKRQSIVDGIVRACSEQGYTLWALAILHNHAHALVRRHRDDYQTIWDNISASTADAMRKSNMELGIDHPVWGNRPYGVYKDTPESVRACIEYIEGNPRKEGLAEQHYDFVQAYDGWPVGWKSVGE